MTVDSLVFPVCWGFRNQKITSCTLIAKTSSTKDFHLTNILCRWSLLKCVFNRIESCTKKKSNYYFLIYQWMFLPFRFDGGKNRHRGQISSLQTCCVAYLSYTAIQPSSKFNLWALPADVCLSTCNKWDERNMTLDLHNFLCLRATIMASSAGWSEPKCHVQNDWVDRKTYFSKSSERGREREREVARANNEPDDYVLAVVVNNNQSNEMLSFFSPAPWLADCVAW
jgi:hypothetical protein